MDISKHPVLKRIYDVTQKVEELGASEELTDIVCDLGDIGEEVDRILTEKDKMNRVLLGHQI